MRLPPRTNLKARRWPPSSQLVKMTPLPLRTTAEVAGAEVTAEVAVAVVGAEVASEVDAVATTADLERTRMAS